MRPLAAALFVGLLSVASAARQDRPPVFRSSSSAVAVNVSVQDGKRPVRGLRADDFSVLDNGVPQTVVDASVESVPIDITLVLDLSGSTSRYLAQMQNDLRQAVAQLRPLDALRVLTIGSYVRELRPLQPAGENIVVPELAPGGASTIFDAVLSALMVKGNAERRSLVIAATDGYDTRSGMPGSFLADIAKQSESLLEVVMPTVKWGWPQGFTRELFFRQTDIGLIALYDAAAATGGRVHQPTVFKGSLLKAFETLYEEFRSSYVLRFVPTASAEGWHTLTVGLKTRQSYTIRARPGYFVQ